MEETTRSAQLRIVVLKWDRLYGDMIRRQIWDVWPNAVVRVYQRGLDALTAMQDDMPELFVTGVKIADMDGLEHLEPFITTTVPILIVTSRADSRTFDMLREVRYDGIYDGTAEGLEHLGSALRQVIQHRLYLSPSVVPHLRPPPRSILKDTLTEKEHVVLSVIGDGSTNKQAADRLGVSNQTVKTHRKRIMIKLNIHTQGDLMLYALRRGYVLVTPTGVLYPGFQRQLRQIAGGSGPGLAVAVPTSQVQPEPAGFRRPRLFADGGGAGHPRGA
jgi:DNA-binding NarL/FixJ family response regulator